MKKFSLIMKKIQIKLQWDYGLAWVQNGHVIKFILNSKSTGEFKEKVGMEIDIATMGLLEEVPLKTRMKLPYVPAVEYMGICEKRRIERHLLSEMSFQ